MRLLLDTHSFLWFIVGDERLSKAARELVEDSDNQQHHPQVQVSTPYDRAPGTTSTPLPWV